MGKKIVDRAAHDGRLIATRKFADALGAAGSTGFMERTVRSRGSDRPHPGFVWLDVTAEWPPLAPSSQLEREIRALDAGEPATLTSPEGAHDSCRETFRIRRAIST